MTACKDSLSGKKAVSATLAGVLAVGMVPAAAFAADQPADAQSGDESISLLAGVTDKASFESGTFAVVDQDGNAVDVAKNSATKPAKFTDNDAAQYLEISTVKPTGGAEVDVAQAVKDGKMYVEYKASSAIFGEDGSKTAYTDDPTDVIAPGTYEVTVYNAAKKSDADSSGSYGDNTNGSKTFYFTIADKAFSGVSICENGKVSDTEFEYTGAPAAVSAVYQGAAITTKGATSWTPGTSTLDAVLEKDAYYATVSYTTGTVAAATDSVTAAGTYTANITVWKHAATETATTNDTKVGSQKVALTIDQLDVAAAAVEVNNITSGNPAISKVNNSTTLADNFELTRTDGADYSEPGAYTETAKLKESVVKSDAIKNYKNYENGVKVTFNKVDAITTNFYYNGTALGTAAKTYDLSKKEKFDYTKISVKDQAGTNELSYEDGDFEITVTDKDGNAQDLSALQTAGTWNVKVRVCSENNDYTLGGSQTIQVKVINGDISASTYFAYKGKVSANLTATYTGGNILYDVTTSVVLNAGTKKKTLEEGTDYKVTVTDNATKQEVTEVVNKGTYTVKVEGITYDGEQTCTLTVNAVKVDYTRVAATTVKGNEPFVAYTGEAIEPVIEYVTNADEDGVIVNGAPTDKAAWAVLPEDAWQLGTITYKAKATDTAKTVKEIKDKGFYGITIAKDKLDKLGNFNITNAGKAPINNCGNTAAAGATASYTANIWVTEGQLFSDVTTDDWFYDEVSKAAKNGYVKGIAGTKLYAPNQGMTRGDVCVVLLRMAGGDLDYNEDGSVNTNFGYNTPFADVDAHTYYAKAIQWAAQMGIVTGFSADTFGPEQTVTREQFATMLARYAKATGADIAEGADISAYADASSVSDWATSFVKWAVGADVMGQNTDVLAPGKDVSRAEVAAMAVRYQPNKTKTDLV